MFQSASLLYSGHGTGRPNGAERVRPAPAASPHPAQEALISDLQRQGVGVERGGEVHQAFFRAPGLRLCLRGAKIRQPTSIQVYPYDDVQTAAADAGQISPAGDMVVVNAPGGGGGRTNSWIAPPHFFHRDQLIMLYLGHDQGMLDVVSTALGPQVAGAAADAAWGLVDAEAC